MFIKIQLFAHKKGTGSSHNGRESAAKRRGTKYHPGNNVGRGKDDTLFSLVDGTVKFERVGKDRKQVSVYAD